MKLSKLDTLKKQGLLSRKKRTREGQTRAFTLFLEALEENPKDAEVWFQLGSIIDDADLHEGAIVESEELIALASDELGKDRNQIQFWQQALKLDAAHVGALIRLGDLYASRDDTRDAVKCFAKVVQVDPKNVQAWFMLGQQYRCLLTPDQDYAQLGPKQKKLFDMAFEAIQKAIALDSKQAAFYGAFSEMGELLAQKNQKEAAAAADAQQEKYNKATRARS